MEKELRLDVQMIDVRKSAVLVAMLLGSVLASAERVKAFELTGAWATSVDQCGKVFVRKGRANEIAFTAVSDRYGGGFIVEAARIRGKFVKCTIKTKNDDGQTLNLIAGCAADIMLSNVQFILKVLDENSIARQFPGMEGIELKYHRCPI
jgi:hypothetical protein